MDYKYRLKVTRAAAEDMDGIYGYISVQLNNPDSAGKLMARIEQEIRRLTDFPFSCEYSRDETLRRKGYRKLVVEHYVVLYAVDEAAHQVVILRAFYGKRDYPNYL